MKVTEVNSKTKWDQFVERHGKRHLFQSWEWGEVQQKLGFALYRFGLFDGRILKGVAQIVVVPAKRGKFIHLRHGPIFKTAQVAEKSW